MAPRTPREALTVAGAPRSPPPAEEQPSQDELLAAQVACDNACVAHLGAGCCAGWCREDHLNETESANLTRLLGHTRCEFGSRCGT
eukprot:9552297-Alexandrium_andersonii.AAC.1